MSAEKSDADKVNDGAKDDEVFDNGEELEPALVCPTAPRLATIELPPDEDDFLISGPSENPELPEGLLLSDYGYIKPRDS